VSLCYYCTIRIPIFKTSTGAYEGGYTYVFEVCCYRTLDIVIYKVSVWDPTAHFKHFYVRICILEGPEDDSVRIETCCPNTIINIIQFCCV
jgi:hypothetical protein